MKGTRFYHTIQVKLIIVYVLLILIAMQLIGVYFIRTIESTFLGTFSNNLNNQAYLLSEYVVSDLNTNSKQQDSSEADELGSNEELNAKVRSFFAMNNADIQIIDANGIVVSTSLQNYHEIVGSKNTQIEVSRALQGIRVEEQILSELDRKRTKIISLPVKNDGRVIGAVYIVASMEEVFETIDGAKQILLSGTFIALGLTLILGIVLSNTLTSPIKEITRKATAIAEGDFNQRVSILAQDEIGQLGNAFNYMTERLREALIVNEEEREKLASILSNMSDGVIATDEHQRIIVINRQAEHLLETTSEKMIGLELSKQLGIPPEQMVPVKAGKENPHATYIELSDEDDGDTQTIIKVTFNEIHRRDEGIAGMIAVLQNVTEEEKLEHARREFVANVSHELRTPLTTIKSYLEALDDGALEEPELAQRFVQVTRNETERMIRLVNDLLHLSRLDSKQTKLRKQSTDISEVLEDVADRFSYPLLQRSIQIHIQIEGRIPEVNLDRDQIDQVLDNLISNALKYTANEGEITLIARSIDEDLVEISVKDNGVGIPQKDIERIFERFYRVDKARSRNMGGTGLGLSIAREIIRAHGGAIHLESEFGRGTTVSFTLPVLTEGSESV